MTSARAGDTRDAIRIDRLLVYLRFARTRSAARAMIETRALRCNRKHVLRGAENAHIGDVLTIMVGKEVRVIKLIALPQRRASPGLARSHYREVEPADLDRDGQIAIAATAGAARTRPADHQDIS